MSVVNKMLNDLDARAGFNEEEGDEYQEPPETKRVRYMIAFIVFVVLLAAGYFAYRTMGPEYFRDLYVQVMNKINGEQPQVQESKKVSVNSALEQMMPTRAASLPKEVPVVAKDTTATQQEASPAETEELNAGVSSTEEYVTVDNSLQQGTQEAAEPASAPGGQQVDATTQTSENENLPLLASGIPAPSPDIEPLQDIENTFIQRSDVEDEDSLIAELNSSAAQAVAINDVSQAIRDYREILSIDLRNHEARKKLAVLHYSNDENGAASVVLNEGIELAPERVDFRLMLARLFYREKKLKQAYAVLAQIEPEVQQNLDYYGLKATVAQELELNAESSHLYGRLVIFEPNRAQWWLGLAVSLDRMGQNDGALRAYENAADLRQLSASVNDFIRQRILELGG